MRTRLAASFGLLFVVLAVFLTWTAYGQQGEGTESEALEARDFKSSERQTGLFAGMGPHGRSITTSSGGGSASSIKA